MWLCVFFIGRLLEVDWSGGRATGIARTSAPSPEARTNYPIYSMLHGVLDRIKAKVVLSAGKN